MYFKSDPDAYSEETDAAVVAVRDRVDLQPQMGLVLGSGLGALVEGADDTTVVPAEAIPGYPESTVEGHEGRLVFGMLEDVPVAFVQGRVHLYEGYSVQKLTFPVRLLEALGTEKLVITNSAGGINRTFEPGTLMFITGHLNLAFASPGVGAHQVSATDAAPDRPFYDLEWTERAEEIGLELGLEVRRGVYAWMMGPSYETPAEIRALDRLGADAVGMSTVPEVIQAQMLGIDVVGLSTITNPAAGLAEGALDHDDVIAVGEQVRGELMELVRGIVRVAPE